MKVCVLNGKLSSGISIVGSPELEHCQLFQQQKMNSAASSSVWLPHATMMQSLACFNLSGVISPTKYMKQDVSNTELGLKSQSNQIEDRQEDEISSS